MCLYPELIINRKYRPTKKNNYNPPVLKDKRLKYVAVGCGECMECLKQKGNTWRIRLKEELKENKTAYFITLTISNENYETLVKETEYKQLDDNSYNQQNIIATRAVRKFLELIRYHTKKSIRHWYIVTGKQIGRAHV